MNVTAERRRFIASLALTEQYCYGTNPTPKEAIADLIMRSLY
ncbi:hypothetical protein [Nostoc sp.]